MERKAPRAGGGGRVRHKESRRPLQTCGFPLTLPVSLPVRPPVSNRIMHAAKVAARRCDVPCRIRAGACVTSLSFLLITLWSGRLRQQHQRAPRESQSLARRRLGDKRVQSRAWARAGGTEGAQHGFSGVAGVCRPPLVRAGRQPRAEARRRARARLPPRARARLCPTGFRPTTTACRSARPWMDRCNNV